MRLPACRVWLAGLALPLLLSGCSLLPTTRKLPVPKAPSIVRTATPQELVDSLNERWDAIHTLTATTEVQATETKGSLAEAFPSARTFILIRKPGMLRVLGEYFGVRVFDMASNGQTFKLEIPSKNKVLEGSNDVTQKSPNPLENLRPGFFLDAMLIRGTNPDDFYSVASDTETVEDPTHKHLLLTPEYILTVMRRKEGSQELTPIRVITIHRDDLLPSEQDIYNDDGILETHIAYSGYQNFGPDVFPSKIVITRPIEGLRLVLSVVKVTENIDLPDKQFQVDIPAGTSVQVLK